MIPFTKGSEVWVDLRNEQGEYVKNHDGAENLPRFYPDVAVPSVGDYIRLDDGNGDASVYPVKKKIHWPNSIMLILGPVEKIPYKRYKDPRES